MSHDDLPIHMVSNLEGVNTSHTVFTTVEVLGFGENVLHTIETIEDGTVTYDSLAESRARVDLTVLDDGTGLLIPKEPDDLLAPFGNELRIRRGIIRTDRIEMVQMGIFGINRSVPNAKGEIAVSGLDRSWHFIETPFEEPYEVASGTQLNDALVDVLTQGWPLVPMDFMETDVELPRLQAEEGEDRWTFAQGLALAAGGELYFSDTGVALLRPGPAAIGTPVATFAEGDEGILLGAEPEWDRGPVINKWKVTGENASDTGPVPRGEAVDDNPESPTFYGDPFGKKPDFYDNEFITTDEQADTVAHNLLLRTMGAPQFISFETLVDPGRRPGDLIRATREKLGLDEDHLIDDISIPLSASGTMSSHTRMAQELVA